MLLNDDEKIMQKKGNTRRERENGKPQKSDPETSDADQC